MKKRLALSIVVIALVAVMALALVGCGDTLVAQNGLSAYELAVKNGFVGTEAEWLASLSQGQSAYDVAVKNGFVGTEAEWLESLKGLNGRDGKDADDLTITDIYQAAVAQGYTGSFLDFVGEYLDENAQDLLTTEVIANRSVLSVVSVYANFTQTVTYGGGWYWGSGSTQTRTQGYASAGSGVIYSLDKQAGDAYIITNYHVVYDSNSNTSDHVSDDIFLTLYGNHYLTKDNDGHVASIYAIPATYIGGSMTYDIAVLKVTGNAILQASEATQVVPGDSNLVTVGSHVLAVGNPEAEGISVTEGVISVDSESIALTAADERTTVSVRVMRLDAAVNSGNSGGGLFDMNGDWIGVVNAKASSSSIDNIAYAIPANVARYVADGIIERYQATGSVQPVQKCMLGVTVTAANAHAVYDQATERTSIKEDVTVSAVTAGGLADGVLQEGDVIRTISVRGTTLEINRNYELVDAMLLARVGDEVVVTFERNGETMSHTFAITAAAVTIIQ